MSEENKQQNQTAESKPQEKPAEPKGQQADNKPQKQQSAKGGAHVAKSGSNVAVNAAAADTPDSSGHAETQQICG